MKILIKDGQRYSLRQLLKDNPDASMPREPSPDSLARYGVYEVARVDPPEYDPMTQKLVESFVENAPGVWRHEWTVTPKTEVEILASLPWQTHKEARRAVVEWIDGLTSQIETMYPSAVRQRWRDEEAAARSVLAGNATQHQTDMMTDEGASKGRTATEQAQNVIENADQFRAIANEVNKLFLATDARLTAASSPMEYPGIFEWAQEQAAPLAQAYGLEVGV